jgi:spore maturation protein CgeB
MRVLFLESSPIWIYGLPNGFQDAGHKVMISGPITKENIPKLISEFKPNLIVTMGWGPEQTKQKIIWIRESVSKSKIPLIYWSVEDSTFTKSWSLPLIKLMNPDFVFTICPRTVELYKKHKINAAHLDFGYHESVHFPDEKYAEYKSSIAVVANAYPHILEKYPSHYRLKSLLTLIQPLLKENIRVDFYGKDWEKMEPYLGINICKKHIHGYIPYTEANKVYSTATITIGLQNYEHHVTQRTYEILGSGGFLLTSDTPGVRSIFVPDRDLIVSSSPIQTLKLVKFHLENVSESNEIRKQALISVASHSYRYRAEYIIKVLKENGLIE